MLPSKKAIADYLQLDRSTVSKILNNYDREKFSRETVERVEQAARDLGYAKNQRRMHPRRSMDGKAAISVYLKGSNALYSRGTADVRNISASGMLMDVLEMETESIPMKPFYFDVTFSDCSLAGFRAKCRPVRFNGGCETGASRNRLLALGVEFEPMGETERGNLEEYLKVA